MVTEQIERPKFVRLKGLSLYFLVPTLRFLPLLLLFLAHLWLFFIFKKIDQANALERAQRAILEYKGLALGRLSQTSGFQTNNEDSSVYTFTLANWDTPAVLEKVTELSVCHTLGGWKEVIIRTVIFSLCSHSSHSMAVFCVFAPRY